MNEYPFSYRLDFPNWKQKLICWVNKNYDYLALFQGNGYEYPEGPFQDFLFVANTQLTEEELWDDQRNVAKVGIFGYDLKNQIEKLESNNRATFKLPDLCFFTPELSFSFQDNLVKSKTAIPNTFWTHIENTVIEEGNTSCSFYGLTSKEEYIATVKKIQDYIIEGETYEMNFCQSFEGSFEHWDPVTAFFRLQGTSPMPFSSLFKAKHQWLVSASPERFIKRNHVRLIGQPIKGTIRRGSTVEEDRLNKERLLASEKERAENLMITDLTRNDLSKVSEIGSVKVDELFGVYALPRVFQMITTVSAELKENSSLKEIIHATFPMGSMTGAPKIRTKKLIEQLESFKRGWFSGAIGWVNEAGDFDFSVVIRSIIADLEFKKLYFGVGSAITIDSDPIQEYEECELKSQAIREVLNGRSKS
ncbi:anthranilate synthase component I family protein [Algoriphagus lutimaris]|uniref:anthranilate synthase component I family protein n=1 Tax=Algoriphagus lutimaris TaxID=613197 RepID=UPI00196AD099|nr:anthranilate synthase component I family protein [Algoriphagus lutimaris]MBN3519741.1 anthranilate synthase component I family protein [Algoriphagus lutimaris]